jgi:hypothetical protein
MLLTTGRRFELSQTDDELSSPRKIAEQYDAKLEGLRWNYWHCRSLGCLAGPNTDRKSAEAAQPR